MEHIRQIELEPSNVVPVGHSEFGASSRYIGTTPTPRKIEIEFAPIEGDLDGDGCGCIVVTLSSNKGTCELRTQVAFAKYLQSCNGQNCSIRSTSIDAKPDSVSLMTYQDTDSKKHYTLRIILHAEQTMLSCHARIEMKGVDIYIWDQGELPFSTIEHEEVLNLRSTVLIPELDYGTALPEPGTPGRIFFVEIQE